MNWIGYKALACNKQSNRTKISISIFNPYPTGLEKDLNTVLYNP